MALDGEEVLKFLRDSGEEPPEEWVNLMKETQPEVDWRDYLGRYFLALNGELSNDEFEDRCYQLLVSIGLKVTQFGHTVKGEFPDGEARLEDEIDIIVVYDCKNTSSYVLNANDKRKLEEYVSNAELKYKDEKGQRTVLGMIIAKSFGSTGSQEFVYADVNSLLYLLYKKLKLGNEFSLLPLRKILQKDKRLDQKIIDAEWR